MVPHITGPYLADSEGMILADDHAVGFSETLGISSGILRHCR